MFIIFENIASYLASVESKSFEAKCFDFAIHGMYEYIVVLVLCQIRDKNVKLRVDVTNFVSCSSIISTVSILA